MNRMVLAACRGLLLVLLAWALSPAWASAMSDDCILARQMGAAALKTFQSDKRKGLAGLIKAVRFCPGDREIGYDLGLAYYLAGYRSRAVKVWRGLVSKGAADKRLLANLAWALMEMGDFDGAREVAAKGGKRFSDEPVFVEVRVKTLLAQRRYLDAYEAAASAPSSVGAGLRKECAGYLVDAGWRKFRSGLEREAAREMLKLAKRYPSEAAFSKAEKKMVEVMLGSADDIPLPPPEPTAASIVASTPPGPGGGGAAPYSGGELLDPLIEKLHPQPVRGDSYALIVGVGDYKSVKDLRYAARDARNVYRLLAKKGFVRNDSAHVHLVLDGEVTLTALRRELKWLEKRARLHPGARIFFYFSGHGAPLIEEGAVADGLILPSDAVIEDLEHTGVRVSYLKSIFSSLPNRQVVAVLDACFSGQGRSVSLAKPAMLRIRDDLVSSTKPFIVSAVHRPAREFPDGRQGAFTYFFLKGLLGEADGLTRKDGWVDAEEAFLYARKWLAELDIDQDPMMTPMEPVRLVRSGR